MSHHRLSKEELDEQFEQFLKESLSDDSFDSNKKSAVLENLGKPKVKKPKKKNDSPWWIAEDDSDDAEQNPCSSSVNRTLEKCMQLEQYYKSKQNICSDEHDDSLSSDSPGSPDELGRTSRSFLKSQSTSQPIEEVEEEDHVEEMQKSIDPMITSIEKDSLEIDESVVASGPNQTFHGVGLDTLEEQEEKERFFARFEKGASSTIDYSKLIKELDSTDSTKLTAYMRNNDDAQAYEDEHKDESKDVSVNYSEDFEDEPEVNSLLIRKSEESDDHLKPENQACSEEEKHGMLAKVLLIDSMDSTIDTQKILQKREDEMESVMPQETNDAMSTGISNQYTNNSDIEALHQAYQNLGSLTKDTEEQADWLKVTDNTITPYEQAIESKENSLYKVLTGNSDISTVTELMQHIRGEEGFIMSSTNIHTDKGVLPFTLHKPIGNDSLQEERGSGHLHEWNGEKSRLSPISPAHKFYINYKSNKTFINKDHGNQEQPTAVQEPSHSDMFGIYSGERSGHADKHGSYSAITASSDLIQNKHPNKIIKSPSSSLKRGQNTHYSYVKSSGYGKISIPMKQSSKNDGLKSKELHMDIKLKSPTDQKQKGILSATKSIRFAENTISCPKDKMENEDTAGQNMLSVLVDANGRHKDTNGETSEIHYLDVRNNDLSILQRLQHVEEKLDAENRQAITLKASSTQEQEFKQEIEQMKIHYKTEIEALKQENFIIQTKLHAAEERMKKKNHLFGDQNTPVTEEKIQQIRQEILEQETLLHGYQQENERLYIQVKNLQATNKQNEQQMFQENLSLKANLLSLREKLNSSKPHNQYAGSELNQNTSSTDLTIELNAVQKRETKLLEDIARYKKAKQASEVDLLQMKKERDLLKGQLANNTDDKLYEIKIIEETHKKEIARLNKRLQWYAENQDIMDKDAGRLKDAYEQIENLKMQVEKLRHDAGNQSVQQQNRLKDRASDAKRIQDLERQVKEMEAIIKRRHPNSIPALMFAAAAVSETDKQSKSSTVGCLERRIQKLENDLESKDDECKKSLRCMEQHFQKVKIQYESRINELEELLAQGSLNKPRKNIDNTVKVKALEQELSVFKDAHQTTVLCLQKEIEDLKAQNLVLEHTLMLKEGNSKLNNNLEEIPDQVRLTRLNQELVSKSKEIQELSKTVERLQKERMMMLSVKPHASTISNRNKQSGKTVGVLPPLGGNTKETETFPLALDDKLYKPDTFTDFHISDLQHQNKRLEAEVLKLTQDMNQQITHYQASLVDAEYALKRVKEEAAEQVAALKQSHQREVEKLICQQALEHSSSRVAELSSKISTQEVLIKHLQKQVAELQKDRETLAVIRIREETLQKEMAKLLDELRMAKECHSPEMKHFLTLESKIKHMEIRHSQREHELQQIIDQSHHVAEATQAKEIEKWKRLVQQKNMELEKFRTELDSILDVLRILQKQGVIIPTSSSEIY